MQEIKFRSLDGLEIYGHLSVPKSKTLVPGIVMISGGIHGGVYTNGKNYDPLHIAITDYLNGQGFATFIVDKRGSKGYGEEYLSHLDLCGKEVEDIIAGGNYLKNLEDINPNLIAVHGTSRSSTTAALTITKTNTFKSAILASGFYDIFNQYAYEKKFRPEIFPTKQSIGNKEISEIPHLKRSPINHIEKIKSPIFLVHGLDDKIILPERSAEFYNILKMKGKDVEMKFYEQFAHLKIYSYPTHPTGSRYWRDCIDFLNRKMIKDN